MSQCPNCKKDFNAGVKAAYRLGLQDGQNEYLKHLNNIEKVFGHLFEELRIMDLRTPDKVNRVYFSRQYLHRLCVILGRNHLGKKCREIRNIMKEQLGDYMSEELKLRELLSEIEE